MKRLSSVIPRYSNQEPFFFQRRGFSLARPALVRFCRELPNVIPIDRALLAKTLWIGRQHFVTSMVDQFEQLTDYGISPQKTFLQSKFYSEAPEVTQALKARKFQVFHDKKPSYPGEYAQTRLKTVTNFWQHMLDRAGSFEDCVIIDEGGLLTSTLPQEVISRKKIGIVEQTNGGLLSPVNHHCLFPRVNVAQSAVKTMLEPILIAETVQQAIDRWHQQGFQPQGENIIGVIGLGVIGRSICDTWLKKGHQVIWYDSQVTDTETHPNLFRVSNIGDVIQNSRIIFGCTGEDCLANTTELLQQLPYDKTFISCSSEDREFYTLLKLAAEQGALTKNPMSTVSVLNARNKKLHVLNGGFPINFYRAPESVPSQDIALTRMLMIGGALQAFQLRRSLSCGGQSINQSQLIQLDPAIQRLAVRCWQPSSSVQQQLPPGLLDKFEDIDWIEHHSSGDMLQATSKSKSPISTQPSKALLFRLPFLNADTPAPESAGGIHRAHLL
jgi:S-adenosylhomocysteine hydrolase